MSQAPDFIRNDKASSVTSEDKLAEARKLAKQFFDLNKEVEDLEEKLEKKKSERLELQHKTIPTFFNEAQLDKIGLPEDNVDIEIKPYYKASIAADWPQEDIDKAFQVLEDLDGDDIIRAKVVFEFLKEEYDDAKELMEFVRTNWPKANMHPSRMDKAVPWTTLTKFVKDYSEDESTDPLTEEQKKALGATIGLIAKIKERKSK